LSRYLNVGPGIRGKKGGCSVIRGFTAKNKRVISAAFLSNNDCDFTAISFITVIWYYSGFSFKSCTRIYDTSQDIVFGFAPVFLEMGLAILTPHKIPD